MSIKRELTEVIRSTGNKLENQAANSFGAAVEDFVRDSFGVRKPGTGGGLPAGLKPTSRTWDATSYAAVLAGATEFRPKLKFLFKVQFFFTPEIIEAFPDLARNTYTFMIKAVDRPKVDFEYEDDVNQYNFRTKALKKIRHRELTITFMDDVGNNVFDFFRTLMAIYSPITREAFKRDNDVNAVPNARRFELGNGMSFSGLEQISQGGNIIDVAHRGNINSFAGNAITLIRVKQVFIDPTLTNPDDKDKSVKSNYYDFINPRLVSFDLDDLNHESSDPNLLTMQFDYDWLEMTTNSGLQSLTDGLSPAMDTVVPSRAGQDESGIPPDILLGRNTNTPASVPPTRGRSNPFVRILSDGANRATQAITRDLADRAAKAVVGDGRFARSKFGRAITGGITDAFEAVGGSVGSIVSSNIRDTGNGLVSTLSTNASNAATRISNGAKSFFSDLTTAGPDAANRVQSQPNPPLPRGDEGE